MLRRVDPDRDSIVIKSDDRECSAAALQIIGLIHALGEPFSQALKCILDRLVLCINRLTKCRSDLCEINPNGHIWPPKLRCKGNQVGLCLHCALQRVSPGSCLWFICLGTADP